jgi:hypothetical protein
MVVTKNIRWTILSFIFAFSALATLFFALGRNEPSYGGRRLSDWLGDLVQPSNPQMLETAADAVRHLGTNAIPVLIKMMKHEDSRLKQALLAIVRKQHFIRYRIVDAEEGRLRASMGFAALGPAARPALPALEPLLANSNSVRFAASSLAGIGPDGIRAITLAQRSTNVIVRRETAGVLGSRGLARFDTNATAEQLQKLYADSEIAIPALITACADPDEFVRTKAAIALGLLGQKPQLVIPVLVKMLAEDKSSWRVPSAAAKALARFGAEAVSAIPELQQALEHSDSRVRESAKAALQTIQATNRAQNETSR